MKFYNVDVADFYGLIKWYNPYLGNILIAPKDLTAPVMASVLKFLSDNTNWVMGYEDIGDGEQTLYITPIENLQ